MFLGISVPNLRLFVKKCDSINLNDIKVLIQSKYNEIRLVGWLLLEKYYKQAKIWETIAFNYSSVCGNWNVVDTAAPICSRIISNEFSDEEVKKLGYELYEKQDLWSVRFSIVMSIILIKNQSFESRVKDSITKIL